LSTAGPGRPRDELIDAHLLEVTRRHLAEYGYAAMSLVAIAEDAGTTRPTIYRRWPTKADLATAAVAALAEASTPPVTDDPYADLCAELTAFRRGITRPDGISMIGTMLVASTNSELVKLFRQRVVRPRRARLRAILERAQRDGLVEADADLDIALTMLTGSWYAHALSGGPAPAHWAERVTATVWRAVGGTPKRAKRRTG
jgi:AcrR family transcriptional regulator